MKCGLLGRKLGHSYSPVIHSFLGEYPYSLFEKEPEELADFLKNGDFSGINVTIPYKKDVIPYLDALSPAAQRIGAVNTIVRRADGSLVGHNTDRFGFSAMLKSTGLSVSGKKVLVLGSGGASNTAVAVLQDAGADVVVISRQGSSHYGNLHLHNDACMIVNTTPVGMFPNTDAAPLELDGFPKLEGVLDVIYNPARTKLLCDAEDRGLITANGLLMLVAQAKEASEWFTGSPVSDELIPEIHRILRQKMENIVLIGMPGSGKSTVGRLLAEKTGLSFVDADRIIEERAGISIPEIFASQGEAGFRQIETAVLKDLGRQSAQVIATGGGCVTREENRFSLHRNGTIFCLDRDLDALPTDGRPLSQSNPLAELYRVRKPMYDRFADHHIDNNQSPESAVQAILSLL